MATTTELSVTGMTCDHCVRAVTDAIEEIPGVQSAKVNLEESRAVVEHDGADMEAIFASIREEGYEPALR